MLSSHLQTRTFGFCFDDDAEAAVFFKKVVDRTRRHCSCFLPPRQRVSNDVPRYPSPILAVFRPFRSNSMNKEKTKTPSSPSKPVKTNIISSPAPHSFVHVSHVGVNTRGIIESSKNIEPAWGALIADLQGYGISPEVMGNNMGFIKELVTGVPDESPSSCACSLYLTLSALDVLRTAPPKSSPTPTKPPPEKKHKIRRKVLIL